MAEITKRLKGQLKGPNADSKLPPISIDSRTLRPGDFFVAIQGKNFNGHDFIPEALRVGASGIMHSRDVVDLSLWKDRMFLQVEDTTCALKNLGGYARKKWGRQLIAISGSMGKTTTREFTATLLKQKYRVFQSPGNLNNEIGVPLSLLRLKEEDELAVVELGMNHSGEIRELAKICQPNWALLTNVAPVHLENFSDIEEIAASKGEILEALPPKGCFFFNADDSRLTQLARPFEGNKVSFAMENSAHFQISQFEIQSLQKMSFQLHGKNITLEGTVPFAGKHFLYNVAAAIAVSASLGLTEDQILPALSTLKVPHMRGQVYRFGPNNNNCITLWDDSYNSNPQAMAMVLETIAQLGYFRRKVLALGEMLELGKGSVELHRQVGTQVANCDPDLLVSVGEKGGYITEGATESGFPTEKTIQFDNSKEAGHFLARVLISGDFLLVKGSRGLEMEKIIKAIAEKK